jgi:hypothetical protein
MPANVFLGILLGVLFPAGKPADDSAKTRDAVTKIVAQIQKADYAGDRTELKRLYEKLKPFTMDKGLASRVRY